ncbi:uncharacterized protein H6S33_012937 [Morchella sextelata]|uniref:uncharacterized protein n=1 Tax=Morchella sextelata TaxID=1174677 RepID=UPI001D0545BB|nr:uncharacterized protein H6S33_012937 [Morchella sextelata]KAH0609451.1 hypothetical protein H6S33_012937 [Morchella sextelata]
MEVKVKEQEKQFVVFCRASHPQLQPNQTLVLAPSIFYSLLYPIGLLAEKLPLHVTESERHVLYHDASLLQIPEILFCLQTVEIGGKKKEEERVKELLGTPSRTTTSTSSAPAPCTLNLSHSMQLNGTCRDSSYLPSTPGTHLEYPRYMYLWGGICISFFDLGVSITLPRTQMHGLTLQCG